MFADTHLLPKIVYHVARERRGLPKQKGAMHLPHWQTHDAR